MKESDLSAAFRKHIAALQDLNKLYAEQLAAERRKMETVRKVFAPVLKNFGAEWEDGTGLEVVLSSPDDEDGEEGTGRCEFTLGQLRRALKGSTP